MSAGNNSAEIRCDCGASFKVEFAPGRSEGECPSCGERYLFDLQPSRRPRRAKPPLRMKKLVIHLRNSDIPIVVAMDENTLADYLEDHMVNLLGKMKGYGRLYGSIFEPNRTTFAMFDYEEIAGIQVMDMPEDGGGSGNAAPPEDPMARMVKSNERLAASYELIAATLAQLYETYKEKIHARSY